MPSAVSFTRPSTGRRSVGSRLNLRSSAPSGAAEPWPGCRERFCVCTWVVTSITGLCSLVAHSTRSISAPYLGSSTRSATRALPVQLTLPGRCQSSALKVGSGIHALSAKVGSRRVVSSKVRQPFGTGVKPTSAEATRGARLKAPVAKPAFKTLRRFIEDSPLAEAPGRGRSLPSSDLTRPSRTNPHRTR